MPDGKALTWQDALRDGHAYWRVARPATALAAYRRALELLPPDAPATHRIEVGQPLALALCETADFAAALAQYQVLHDLACNAGLDRSAILRQWGKALEQTGDFAAARAKYDRGTPTAATTPLDRLKWHHGVGLLNWRDGRLTEAREHLAAAVALMPKHHAVASQLLAVLGNDALLSLELGDVARAMRLAGRMLEIRAAVDATTLSNEVNLARVRAALEQRRGNWPEAAAILRAGIALLEDRAPDEWMRRLDLANDYVAAVLEAGAGHGPQREAITYLSALGNAAPEEVAWIACFMLARLQIAAGDAAAAREELAFVLASFIGTGSAAGEVEIVIELARLLALIGNAAAAILLGKLVLTYLAEIAHAFEGMARRKVVEAGDEITRQTARLLRAAGRYEEALAIEALLQRVQRHALLLRTGTAGQQAAGGGTVVPLDGAERRAELGWLAMRKEIAQRREAGERDAALRLARQAMAAFERFETSAGMARRPALAQAPAGRTLRLGLLPQGAACTVQYRWADRTRVHRIEVSEKALFGLIAELRQAVADPEAWRSPAARLHTHLIAPVADELVAADCLEIDASGALGRVPFCLLGSTGQSLSQQVAIRYVLDAPPLQLGTTGGAAGRRGLLHATGFATGPLTTKPGYAAAPGLQPVATLNGPAFSRAGLIAGLAARPTHLSIAAHFDSVPTNPEHWALTLGSDEPLYLSDLAGAAFDLDGVRIALLASCSSGLDDATWVADAPAEAASRGSLTALALEKGVGSVIGTLWDISETAAADFTAVFWAGLASVPMREPAALVAMLQADWARSAAGRSGPRPAAGGIGDTGGGAPADWAGFAVFENGNRAQPPVRHARNPDARTDAPDRETGDHEQ
jgi:CHAT domain-containing protein